MKTRVLLMLDSEGIGALEVDGVIEIEGRLATCKPFMDGLQVEIPSKSWLRRIPFRHWDGKFLSGVPVAREFTDELLHVLS